VEEAHAQVEKVARLQLVVRKQRRVQLGGFIAPVLEVEDAREAQARVRAGRVPVEPRACQRLGLGVPLLENEQLRQRLRQVGARVRSLLQRGMPLPSGSASSAVARNVSRGC
jgi:hypothetical protein